MVREGSVELTTANTFYNPHMALNRDITVSVVNALSKKTWVVCDALAGTGAKGLRIAKECNVWKVILNDNNPKAIPTIKKNAKKNKVKNIEVYNKDANLLLSEFHHNKFNCIDIDPFGTPAPFIDSACRAMLPKDALLCVTATDTGALCGSFQNAALRKYGLRLQKTSFYNELGVRALIAFCVRMAAKHDIGLKPVFSHSTRHYYRTFLLTARGKTAATKAMKELKHVFYCFKCDSRSYKPFKCHNVTCLGPVWSANLWDKKVITKMKPVSKEAEKLIALCKQEATVPEIYYDLHVLCKKNRKRLKKMELVMDALKSKGYKAVRTHFNPHAIRTNASFSVLSSLL